MKEAHIGYKTCSNTKSLVLAHRALQLVSSFSLLALISPVRGTVSRRKNFCTEKPRPYHDCSHSRVRDSESDCSSSILKVTIANLQSYCNVHRRYDFTLFFIDRIENFFSLYVSIVWNSQRYEKYSLESQLLKYFQKKGRKLLFTPFRHT